MHFWIDKRSQGCGFNVHQIPPSLSGYGRNQRNLCNSFYPKPMVTPVHRFQSIESGLRNSRSGYHARIPLHCSTSVHYNGSSIRIPPAVTRSSEMVDSGQSPATRHVSSTSKLKCGVWIFFAIVTFFLAGAKYYFHGINIGVEVLVFCSLLVVVLLLGGLISLCEAIVSYSPANNRPEMPIMRIVEEQEADEPIQDQGSSTTHVSSELPPPPYHIAVMLSPRNDLDEIRVIRDSPPPSYEKAVT
ncbi:uncharacterized protein LOC130446197 isoform X1 [Diorhabda sublineata]|uniref:uncharacterized protein LOC130446197 isoform X1 n=1 Tax=Diorhabda sublineata TaxID=1163346 RepID=UPI0024E165B6|nr:uncharacterized protein LOC130446197 isoform X1 [Diorhabda sublineata]XP_056638258.1 uncharacterized protein LOC130446197 isoform X1 [Diorhabda sublineata]XP_056638259.1 uncharacterized protein LOC130446197 isoform X1 [Diorhabda sublineata]